jgi:ABC-type tungstate transport system permease subunit
MIHFNFGDDPDDLGNVRNAQDIMSRMAVTTSFCNSGLAEVLLPAIAEDLL